MSGLARNLAAVIALLLLAAVVAGLVVLMSTDSSDGVNAEEVVRENVEDQIDGLRDLIQDNVR